MKQHILSSIPTGATRAHTCSRRGVQVELFHLSDGANTWEIFKFTKGKRVAIEARGQEPTPDAVTAVKLQKADTATDTQFSLLLEGNELCRDYRTISK